VHAVGLAREQAGEIDLAMFQGQLAQVVAVELGRPRRSAGSGIRS